MAETRRQTWDPAGAATPNYRPGQEVVVWPSTALLDVDADHVGDAWVRADQSSDTAAAGAWSGGGMLVKYVQSACARNSPIHRSYFLLNARHPGLDLSPRKH